MYLRRLRSIMDQFLNGWVEQQFTNNYNSIVVAANKDNAKWNAGSPALGYKCIPPTHRFLHLTPTTRVANCSNLNCNLAKLLCSLTSACAARRQMITETLPIRKQQLYDTYGPGGQPPLIPAAQVASPSITFGDAGGVGDAAYLELLNPQKTAVDLSGWKLGGAAQFTFHPGAVPPEPHI